MTQATHDTIPDPNAEARATSIVLLAVAAMGIGLVQVYSATANRPLFEGGRPTLGHPFLTQAIWVLLSLTSIAVVARLSSRTLERLAPFALLGAVVLLIGLQIPGVARPINGATRWFRVGPLSFQPSELAKVGLVLFLAWFLARGADPLRSFLRGFLPTVAVIAVVVGLVAMQPDFGTSLFLAATGGVLMLLAGARVLHLVPMIIAAGGSFTMFMIDRFDHVQARIDAFRDPMSNYNTQHSLLALGSGGVTGVGLGNGRQKLDYLPENASDFIFSILGEELGLIGAGLVLALYVVFLWKGASIALHARDTFGFYLASGATLLVVLQAMIHIAVATASAPTKGIPLPFISLGGSNLLCLSIGVGLLACVARQGEVRVPRTT